MSFSNAAETEVLNYIFKDTPVSWDGQANLWMSLHEGDPGEAGSAVTNETAYTNYARVQLTRASDITVALDVMKNTNLEQFPTSGSGPHVITYAQIVTTASGAGVAIARCILGSSLTVNNNVTPQFAAEALTFTLN